MASKRKPTDYQLYLKKRIPELRAEGVPAQAAMGEAAIEWKARKRTKETKVATKPRQTKVTGKLRSLKAEIPYVVESHPDLAAAWDIAAGILDYLAEHAAPADAGAAAARRAAAVFARAHSEHTSDQTENELGRAVGEVLVHVAVHQGLTRDGWAALAPPELGAETGLLSSTAEAVLGTLGLGGDLNGDGTQGTVGRAVSGALGMAADGAEQQVLNLLGMP